MRSRGEWNDQADEESSLASINSHDEGVYVLDAVSGEKIVTGMPGENSPLSVTSTSEKSRADPSLEDPFSLSMED